MRIKKLNPRIVELRAMMTKVRHHINNRPLWMEEQREWMTLSDLEYQDRIENKSYNIAINKLDRLARELSTYQVET